MQVVVVIKMGGLQNYLQMYLTGCITGADVGKSSKRAKHLDMPSGFWPSEDKILCSLLNEKNEETREMNGKKINKSKQEDQEFKLSQVHK